MSHQIDPNLSPVSGGDNVIKKLPSPPRIKRVRNRRSIYDTDGGENSTCSGQESVPFSVHPPCHRKDALDFELDFHARTESSSMPQHWSSFETNNDIDEFRRRLENVKERRARQMFHSQNTSQSSPQTTKKYLGCLQPVCSRLRESSSTGDEASETWQEALVKSFLTNRTLDEITLDTTKVDSANVSQNLCYAHDQPMCSGLHESSSAGDESSETSQEAKVKSFLTNRTLDITLDTTMDSENLQSLHRTPLAPPSISSEEGRKDNICKNNSLQLRRLICTSPCKKVDTSFAQIRETIKDTDATNTFNFNCDRHNFQRMRARDIPCDETLSGWPFGTRSQKQPLLTRKKRNSWFRKEPWYLRDAHAKDSEEIVVDDDNTNSEVLDRMMHAVIFVTET